ncbi:MAG TPA: hypothetical protein VGG57_05480 [Stellaceae bacterium]
MPSSRQIRLMALGATIAVPATAFAAGPMTPTVRDPHPINSPQAAALAATAVARTEPATAAPAQGTTARATSGTTAATTATTTTVAAGPQASIAVSTWGFSQTGPGGPPPVSVATSGRPIYVWFTLDGGQAAVDQLRSGSPMAIQVHWTNDNPSGHAPPLTTSLTVGRPGLAATFQGEVQRTGSFQWHSWTRKDALSPGRWTVSVTAPDGQPISCGQSPCQLSFDVG